MSEPVPVPEPRPCPFCGSTMISVGGGRLPKNILTVGGKPLDFVFFGECGNCFAKGPIQLNCEEAMNAWNEGVKDD